MKNQIIVLSLLISVFGYSQNSQFGIVAGVNNYSTDTGFLSSKSGNGYYLGVLSTIDYSDKSQLQLEIGITKNFIKFLGRNGALEEPKEATFSMENPVVNVFYNYSFFENDVFKLGANIGPSLSFLYEYKPVRDLGDNFMIDPLLAEPFDLLFDTRNEEISFNMFAGIGLTAYYKESVAFNFRYFHGLTDPYRKAPVVAIVDITGRDSYLLFSVGYLW